MNKILVKRTWTKLEATGIYQNTGNYRLELLESDSQPDELTYGVICPPYRSFSIPEGKSIYARCRFCEVTIMENFLLSDGGGGGGTTEVSWDDISDKPESFPPEHHTHSASDINSGQISIEQLPDDSLERLVEVADEAERFALTIDQVQNGDSVKQLDDGSVYTVIDDTKLDSPLGYAVTVVPTATDEDVDSLFDGEVEGSGQGIDEE